MNNEAITILGECLSALLQRMSKNGVCENLRRHLVRATAVYPRWGSGILLHRYNAMHEGFVEEVAPEDAEFASLYYAAPGQPSVHIGDFDNLHLPSYLCKHVDDAPETFAVVKVLVEAAQAFNGVHKLGDKTTDEIRLYHPLAAAQYFPIDVWATKVAKAKMLDGYWDWLAAQVREADQNPTWAIKYALNNPGRHC